MNNVNITEYIANKIRFYRENRNMTQQEVADILNTTQQSIARYESGERKADQNILFALADCFKISINDFFPPIHNKQDENEQDYQALKGILKRNGFLSSDEDLSKENVDKLIAFIKANKKFIMKEED